MVKIVRLIAARIVHINCSKAAFYFAKGVLWTMKHLTYKMAMTGIALMLVLVFAGCGSDRDDSSTESSYYESATNSTQETYSQENNYTQEYGTGEYGTGEYGTGEYGTGEYGTDEYGTQDMSDAWQEAGDDLREDITEAFDGETNEH
jgi:uncharacterized membrane protein